MRRSSRIIGIILLFLIISLLLAQNASGQVASSDELYEAHVTSVTIDPETFFPYDTGTVTVQMSNSGNQTVSLSHPDILGNNVKLLNSEAYNTVVRLGPGNTMTYSFLISMNPPEGTYFPLFTVSVIGGKSISYPFKIEVDSKNLSASIVNKPDNFSIGKPDTVNLSIVNRRDGTLKNILITPAGNGINVIPMQAFISTLSAGSSEEIPFQVTPNPGSDKELHFHITYQNGNNERVMDVILPINIGEDKTAVVPVINNVAVVNQGSYYHLTGNVNNAGVTDAMSLVVTVEAPARAVEPYSEYAVGTLTSGDYSSFELTFTASNLSSVPLQVQWKDADGNTFSTVKNLDLRSVTSGGTTTGSQTISSGSPGTTSGQPGSSQGSRAPGGGGIFGFGGTRGGGISSFYPVIVLVIIVIVAAVLWKKRRWVMVRLKKQ
jgi:hypothetical protein